MHRTISMPVFGKLQAQQSVKTGRIRRVQRSQDNKV